VLDRELTTNTARAALPRSLGCQLAEDESTTSPMSADRARLRSPSWTLLEPWGLPLGELSTKVARRAQPRNFG